MKPINYLLVLMFAMVTFVSCDTYGDYEQEFAPIYPLSGQYYVKVLDENNEELVISTTKDDDESYNVYGTYLYLYNTADNDKDKLWIKLPNTSLFKQGILGKISCNVEELTFNGTAGNMVADGTTPVGGIYSHFRKSHFRKRYDSDKRESGRHRSEIYAGRQNVHHQRLPPHRMG